MVSWLSFALSMKYIQKETNLRLFHPKITCDELLCMRLLCIITQSWLNELRSERGLPLTSIGSGTSQADLTTLIDFIFKTSLANWEIALMTSHKHLPISIKSNLFTTRVAEVSSGVHHLWFWSTLCWRAKIVLRLTLWFSVYALMDFYMKEHKVIEGGLWCKGCGRWW